METSKKAATPPYVAYKTLKNFLERFRQGTPGRIERGLMGTMSGAVQSQLTTALKYLGFMSEHSVPTDVMKQYVVAQDSAQTDMLRGVLTGAYPYIFSDDFDFGTATGAMLRERFEEHTTATGETVTRCIAFLKDAAQDAGIPVSQFLSHKKSGNGGQRKKSMPTQRKAEKQSSEEQPPAGEHHTKHPPIAAQDSLLLWGLFQRLPKPGSAWPKAERDRWTETLNNVLALEYTDK
jgi:hypothetical protein